MVARETASEYSLHIPLFLPVRSAYITQHCRRSRGSVYLRSVGEVPEGRAMWTCIMASVLAGNDPAAKDLSARDLAAPVRLLASGQLINVDVGHAAPFYADIKGDGKGVLLVGQFGQGKLRLYPNVGGKTEPRFDKFDWLKSGGTICSVPTG